MSIYDLAVGRSTALPRPFVAINLAVARLRSIAGLDGLAVGRCSCTPLGLDPFLPVILMSSPIDPLNPYASPFGGQAARWPGQPNAGLPIFAKVMFIIDLVFCGLRIPIVLIGIVGYGSLLQAKDPLLPTALGEIVSGLGIALFGIAGDVLALLRKPWAVWLCCLALLSTFASLGVALWQVTIQGSNFPAGSPQRMGFYIGVGFVLIIRLTIIALYSAALVQFANWGRRQLAPHV